MKNIIIIGAGGFGRELESYLTQDSRNNKEWIVKGFLDDNSNALENKFSNLNIIGQVNSYNFEENDYALIGIASSEIKHKLVSIFREKGVKMFTFISDNVYVGLGVEIKEGAVICPNVIIPNNSKIGEFVTININCTIGHDSVIGEYTSIMPSVNIGGETILGTDVFLGTNTNVAPRISIADNVFVGIGAVVIKSLTDAGTYFGNPARKMR